MKVQGHKNEIRVISCKLFHSQTYLIPRYNTKATSNDISFLDLEVRSRSNVKVKDVEVSAFSEWFLFFYYFILFYFILFYCYLF